MEMLKATTIWESASRPLFVRSIWLEAQKTGRTGSQRHFILDYEPRQGRVHSKSAVSSRRRKTHVTLQHSNSYDFVGDWQNHTHCGFVEDVPTNLLLIVPAKVEPLPSTTATATAAAQQQTTQQSQQKYATKSLATSSRAQKQRATLFFRNHVPRRGPLHELYELYSRHSSLQDLQSTLSQANSHADERLAERVLNWLDLAGKRIDTQHLKTIDNAEMVKRTKKVSAKVIPSQAMQGAGGGSNATAHKTQRLSATNAPLQASASQPPSAAAAVTRSRKHVRYANAMCAEETPSANQAGSARPTDPVKHITIIFDREGVPVRFNRPVRNIDLCSLSTSPATVRRLAGPLASARLYSEAERPVPANQPLKTKSTKLRSSDVNCGGTFVTKATNKRPHDAGVFDAKKQLHIFMPSLPKKGLLTAVGTNGGDGCGSVDDSLSMLSNTFSELCKI